MTELLEKAIREASSLPEGEQDALALWILRELQSERRWQDLFDHSQDQLANLANEALAEYRDGKTEELDPDRL